MMFNLYTGTQTAFCGIYNIFLDIPGLNYVAWHKNDTGNEALVASRPYWYDLVKQGIIDYHMETMLHDDFVISIDSAFR